MLFVTYLPASAYANEVVVRINAGGSDVTLNGESWLEDRYYIGGTHYVAPAELQIEGTDKDVIYRSERFATEDRGTFRYEIPVPQEGHYLVRLHFAETYFGVQGDIPGEPGQRVFDVQLEGREAVRQDIDLIAEVGPATALVRSVEVDVFDNVLNIDFDASVDRPKISGIEVFLLEPALPVAFPEDIPKLAWFLFEPLVDDLMLEGSVVVRDAHERGTVLVVMVQGLQPGEFYSLRLAEGECGENDPVSTWTLRGRTGLGTTVVPISFSELLEEPYYIALMTPEGTLLACAELHEQFATY